MEKAESVTEALLAAVKGRLAFYLSCTLRVEAKVPMVQSNSCRRIRTDLNATLSTKLTS